MKEKQAHAFYEIITKGGMQMGEKDKAAKQLEEYADVFADIFNTLLLKADKLEPERLLDAPTESVFPVGKRGKLAENRRDIAKYYHKNQVILALCATENQENPDKDMAFRMMGYDYTQYAKQQKRGKERYPVISIVLHYGKSPWNQPTSIKESLTVNSPLNEYVQDYKAHIFSIGYLPKEIREQFTSDFRIIADFFAQKISGNWSEPVKQEIIHIEAVLDLLCQYTGDERYIKIESEILAKKEKGEKITMCEFIDHWVEEGMQQGIQQGIQTLVTTLNELRIPKEQIIQQIMKGYALSYNEALVYVEKGKGKKNLFCDNVN